MVNALFVLIVFLLQLNKDNIHVKWPFGVRTNITYDESTQEVNFYKGFQREQRHQQLGFKKLWLVTDKQKFRKQGRFLGEIPFQQLY